jgi:hypothetical protein
MTTTNMSILQNALQKFDAYNKKTLLNAIKIEKKSTHQLIQLILKQQSSWKHYECFSKTNQVISRK